MQVALTPVQLIGDPVFKRHVLGNYAPGQYEERTTPYVPPPPFAATCVSLSSPCAAVRAAGVVYV